MAHYTPINTGYIEPAMKRGEKLSYAYAFAYYTLFDVVFLWALSKLM